MHSTSWGSGSHSLFSIHVDMIGPLNTCPGGQANVALVPTRAGLLLSDTLTDTSIVGSWVG